MHYGQGAFYRPLFENEILQLQVQRGCSHNRCAFCDMYHETFAPSTREEILADIEEAASAYPYTKRVFLTGGNAFCLPQDTLMFVLGEVAKRFTSATVGAFARVTDVARKTDDELAALAKAGMCDISIGTESGLDSALAQMGKGFTAADSLCECLRLDAAGLSYDLFYLIGMAGAGHADESAEATAKLYSELHPNRIMIHTMTAFKGTRLREMIDAGEFTPAGELENVRELRRFAELLDCENDVFVLGNHIGNAAPVSGYLPSQREQMLESYDYVLAHANEQHLARYRASMRSI